jgi:hypothetical protein
MWRAIKQGVLAVAVAAILVLSLANRANAQVTTCTNLPGEICKTGTLEDGATYLIEVPANWNGTLFLYSHGYVIPGSANPPMDVGDPATGFFLLSNGYALAGSSYAHTGWAIQEALSDQIAVLGMFNTFFPEPARTIAAVGTLLKRVETGHWSAVEANTLNGDATALGPDFNFFPVGTTLVPTPPAFVNFLPGPYPRPFDSLAAICPRGVNHGCPFAFLLQH